MPVIGGKVQPSTSIRGGLGGGAVTVQDVTVTRMIDKVSPVLFKFCMSQRVLPEVLITQRKRGGNSIARGPRCGPSNSRQASRPPASLTIPPWPR
jgi:hypothetical protein